MNRASLFALTALLVAAGPVRAQEQDTLKNTLGLLPEFKLTDQQGNTVNRDRLLGKVCVVSFFFTCCSTVCPKTQTAMEELQAKFAGSPDVLLVSISVFPSNDTQDVLHSYAAGRHADPARWLF